MKVVSDNFDLGLDPTAAGVDIGLVVQQGARSGRTIYVRADGESAPSTVPGDIVLTQVPVSAGEVTVHGSWAVSYSGTQSTIATTVPSGGSGKVGIIVAAGTSGQSPSTPTGWTLLGSVMNDGTSSVEMYMRLLDGESGNNAPVIGGGALRSAMMVTLDGTSTSDITVETAPFQTGSGSSHNPAAVTTSADNAVVLSVMMAVFDARVWAAPSNMTELENESGVRRGLAVASVEVASAGSFDPDPWTLVSGGSSNVVLATLAAVPA